MTFLAIHDHLLGVLAAHDPEPVDAWSTFEFLYRYRSFQEEDVSICLLSFVQFLMDLKDGGFLRLIISIDSGRLLVLTSLGRDRINAILGLAGLSIQQLRDKISDTIEDRVGHISRTGKG